MSGYCVCLDTAGHTIDAPAFAACGEMLKSRGPDGYAVHVDGCIGMAHAVLRTTGSGCTPQPATLDGTAWIVADARIDGQGELRDALLRAGHDVPRSAGDAELILHAYRCWGERCAERLLGDFSFAIWDASAGRLFCARDPFGVKPLFHARHGSRVFVTNTLEWAKRQVGEKLDDATVGDYLLFGFSLDPSSTFFSAIRRLAPGHSFRVAEAGLQMHKYWEIPEPEVRDIDASECVERFRFLLRQSVSDRLRTDHVAVELSGGMDSTAIAATARQVGGDALHMKGFTIAFRRWIQDDEEIFARLAAGHLAAAQEVIEADSFPLFGAEAKGVPQPPEPLNTPVRDLVTALPQRAAAFSRVALTGWDGDALLNESPKPYFRSLVKQGRLLKAALGAGAYAMHERRLPSLWRTGLRPTAVSRTMPAWIDPGFARRIDLEERCREFESLSTFPKGVRPYAQKSFRLIQRLSAFFDVYDPAVTGAHIEFRHPLLDVRLIEFVLSIPPYPWCVRKQLLRDAMRPCLPEAILNRRKTPLSENPNVAARAERAAAPVTATVAGNRYVQRAKVPRDMDDGQKEALLRADALLYWLQGGDS